MVRSCYTSICLICVTIPLWFFKGNLSLDMFSMLFSSGVYSVVVYSLDHGCFCFWFPLIHWFNRYQNNKLLKHQSFFLLQKLFLHALAIGYLEPQEASSPENSRKSVRWVVLVWVRVLRPKPRSKHRPRLAASQLAVGDPRGEGDLRIRAPVARHLTHGG